MSNFGTKASLGSISDSLSIIKSEQSLYVLIFTFPWVWPKKSPMGAKAISGTGWMGWESPGGGYMLRARNIYPIMNYEVGGYLDKEKFVLCWI